MSAITQARTESAAGSVWLRGSDRVGVLPGLNRARLGAAGLSPREIEVLELVARGLINVAIGSELGISPRTVQKHLERVHAKLEVGTRMAAVAVAHAISWAPDPGASDEVGLAA